MYKICLVEDEENLNNLIKSYLERAGYEVVQYYKSSIRLFQSEYNKKLPDHIIPDSFNL